MSYIEQTLANDEKIKVVAELHWFAYIKAFTIAFVAFVFLLIGLINLNALILFALILTAISIYYFLIIKTTEMVVTNKRVICKVGIISIKTEELKNKKIEAIEMKQNLFGRIFDYGNICFSGTGTSKVKFVCVSRPHQIKNNIDSIVDKSYLDFSI